MSTTEKEIPQKKHLTQWEALLVGAVAGVIETSIQMPLITWKICVQEGRPFPRTVPEWWRGVFVNAGSVGPITAIQCFGDSLLRSIARKSFRRSELSDLEKLLCAAGAGALSGIIYGPADLLVIQQQKMTASLGTCLANLRRDYGIFSITRGMMGTCAREAIYTMGYLGVAPVLDHRFLVNFPQCREHPVLTTVFASILGGSFAAFLTHPVDTTKVCVQSDMTGDIYPSVRRVIPSMYREGGIRALYNGFLPRTLRLCGACFVVSQVRQAMHHWKGDSDESSMMELD